MIPDFLDKDSQKKQSLRQQFAYERIPLSLFAPAPSAISWVPLTRNLSPAGPSPAPSKALGTRNSLLRYGIRIRCQKQPPGVRDAFSKALGAKNRLMCTEGKFGTGKGLLVYRTHLRKRKTASWGTRRVFGDPQNHSMRSCSSEEEPFMVTSPLSYNIFSAMAAQASASARA